MGYQRTSFGLLLSVVFIALNTACQHPVNQHTMSDSTKDNPLLCDPDSGVCEIPGQTDSPARMGLGDSEKPVRIVYYTDPICSSCWGIEPQLRRLKLEYGDSFHMEYHMGGLLPDWNYNSGGISKPADVAHHWDEVSLHYDMPIDGDVWLEDPLDSSYPPSIAFKAAQMQDEKKAVSFLRILREMLFLEKKNITKWEFVELAANQAGLDSEQLKVAYEGSAKTEFEADLKLAQQMGVRGFPSIYMMNEQGQQEFVYGSRPYENYESALLKVHEKAPRQSYDTSLEGLFSNFPTLTIKEYAVLSGRSRDQAMSELEVASQSGLLSKTETKNGDLYKLK